MHCCNNNCQQNSCKKQPKEFNCWCCCKEKVNEYNNNSNCCGCNSCQNNFDQKPCFETNFNNNWSEY